MTTTFKRFISPDSGPFAQFVKYGAIGVLSTLVQMAVFYALAATCLKCLAPGDWAVRLLRLPSVEIADALRSLHFAIDTVVGFAAANVFCWLMNRTFVFKPGRYVWYKEFALFFGVAALAMGIATAVSWALIHAVGLMTTLAVFIEIVVSFLLNFFIRKYFIFKG